MKYFLFLAYLSIRAVLANDHDLKCYNETTTNFNGDETLWYATHIEKTINSHPLCLDDKKYLMSRDCTEDGWNPIEPPTCNYNQESYEEANKCPMGYDEIKWKTKSFCVLVTTRQAWNDTCRSAGSSDTIFDLDKEEIEGLNHYLDERLIHQMWMPAKQIWDYSPFVWMLPGEMFGEVVDFEKYSLNIVVSEMIKQKCFSISRFATGYMGFLKNCLVKHPILCLYKQKPLIQLACPDKFYTTRYEKQQNLCFSTHRIMNMSRSVSSRNQSSMMWVSSECRGELYIMNSVEKTVIFEELGRYSHLSDIDRCLFGVNRNTYIANKEQWIDLVPTMKFVNWALPSGNGSVVTTDKLGKWHWTSNTFSCIACQRRLDLRTPYIELMFNQGLNQLYLVIYDREFLWRDESIGVKCFTNSNDKLLKTVEIDRIVWNGTLAIHGENSDLLGNSQTKTIVKLKIDDNGPGHYWCEAFAIPNFNHIFSKKIVAYSEFEGDVFSVLVEAKCYSACEIYLRDSYAKNLVEEFSEFIDDAQSEFIDEISILNIRLMLIESIDTFHRSITVVFHMITKINYDNLTENVSDYLSDKVLTVYKMRNILKEIFQNGKSAKFTIISLNSTEYCLPEFENGFDGELQWNSAQIGDTLAPEELCLISNGLPILRECAGDFIYGGDWRNLTKQHCHNKPPSQITQSLYEIERTFLQSNETSVVIEMVRELVANYNDLIPADLYYLSKIVTKINAFNSDSTTFLTENEFNNIFAIYNSLMHVNENITKTSAALNATNILLEAFDTIVNNLPSANISSDRIKLTENLFDGTIAAITSKLVIFVIDPNVKNISGIALFKNYTKLRLDGESNDFYDFTIQPIYKNQSATEVLEMDNLEIAAFVPENLLMRLNETRIEDAAESDDIYIIVTVYYNDILFQQFKNVTYAKPGGKIISVTIPGYGPMLPDLLPIFIRTDNFTDYDAKHACGYWNLKKDEGWHQDGCDYNGYGNSVVLCACSHLTHFSYLILGTYVHSISVEDDVIITQIHLNALDMITLLGCSLSLFGILGIYITALIFPYWREKASSKVLLHLSTAIALQMIILCFINTEASSSNLLESDNVWACVLMGSALHYSVLVAFSWMLITAYLQFMRYVRVLGQTRCSRFFLKSFICGWIVPLIPVLIVALFFPNSYIPNLNEYPTGICYPTGLALLLGVILPIALVISANLSIFIVVLWNVFHGPDGSMRTNERDVTLAQLRLSILLFFLLGLTWFFGFLATTRAGLLFSYLFCLIATLQGFVLFLYFIILDPVTRNLWNRFFKKIMLCSKKSEFY